MSAVELTLALDGKWYRRYGIARCPAHDDGTPSLAVSDGPGGILLVHCHAGCSQAAVIAALDRLGAWPKHREGPESTEAARETQRQRQRQRDAEQARRTLSTSQYCQRLWHEAEPNTPQLRRWLEARHIDPDAVELACMGHALRWHPRCPRGGTLMPAMLALMTHPITNEPTGLHRTFLLPDGSAKAPVPSARMMLGKAGVARLTHDEDIELGLAIAEGIETSLSIMARGWRPIWACGSLGALQRFPVQAGIEHLTIFADPKPHEVEGARQCARRWVAAGREARVWMSNTAGDFNTLLGSAP
jgi:putative DNA primase/helicase